MKKEKKGGNLDSMAKQKYDLINDPSKLNGSIYLFDESYTNWDGAVLYKEDGKMEGSLVKIIKIEIERKEVVICLDEIGIAEFDFVTDPSRATYLYSVGDDLLEVIADAVKKADEEEIFNNF